MVAGFIFFAVAVLLAASVQGDDGIFEVYFGEWKTCTRINASLACYRTRDVYCRTATDGKPAPWRYCSERRLPRLASVEECECGQDCVVTMWSAWTPCNNGEVYTTRQRSVAAPKLRNGKPCPALHEKKRCEMNTATIANLERKHTWRLGSWRECVPFRHCGQGLRRRSVDCVDLRGVVVNYTLCLEEEAYLHVLPPQVDQLCEVACKCILNVWDEWSECTLDCTLETPRLVRTRTRTIKQYPTLGKQCGHLVESDICPMEADCSVYHWETSGWSECSVSDESASCGVGLQKRYVYCIDGVSLEHVGSENCNSSHKPSSLSSCEVPCTQHCEVGEWNTWEQCPTDTCNVTYTHRNRTVVVEPSGQGTACPHLVEFRECPQLPCYYWGYGTWSSCFSMDECGNGSTSRVVQCMDIEGNTADNELCEQPFPEIVAQCYKHCIDDACVISDWSEWSECSETCDNVQGVQTRSRYYLVNSTGYCVHENSEFVQQRTCSVDVPCVPEVYHIQHSQWGVCYLPSGTIVNGEVCEGIQNRTAMCFKDGQPVMQSECTIPFRTFQEQSCSMPCTRQCLMSEWSSYSECSSTSCKQTRTRRLLHFGNNCPYVDGNGVQSENVPCESPCDPEYHWVAEDNWSPCRVFLTPLSQSYVNSHIPVSGVNCGQGYRNRSVVCQDENGEAVEDSFCSAESKPLSLEACVVPCDRHCIVTDWTDYSVCGANNMMERRREIIPFKGSDDYMSDCPELESLIQVDEEQCPSHDFSHFWWLNSLAFGELHACYLDPDETCGPGKSYRTYSCVDRRSQSHAVSSEFCDQETYRNFDTVQSCTDPCTIDCEYSEWSVWSSCSVSCGHGYSTRTRRIERVPEDEGRLCGRLNENKTCEMPACNYVEYDYTPFSICLPTNQSSMCGEGVRVSDPICLVNGVAQPNTSLCSSLGSRAQRRRSCAVPCEGECVLSEWGEWFLCTDCRYCSYKRIKTILRAAGVDNDCSGELHETESCSTRNAEEFAWLPREWTDCIVEWSPRSLQDYCGSGIQTRMVECTQRFGDVTYDEKCSHLRKPVAARSCFVPCPVDCVVGSFSEWSGCQQCSSDLGARMSRERRVLVQRENGGRSCPHLIEEQSCPNIGCDEYFVETNSSSLDCYSERSDQVCGRKSHTILLCRRNRDYVPLEECVKANASGEIVHNVSLLNHKDMYCDIDCPVTRECNFTEYGAWSECLHICNWPDVEGSVMPQFWFQFRTRHLLSSWEGHDCHEQQQEVRSCDPNVNNSDVTQLSSKCIQFNWSTSEWHTDNSREVQCYGNGSQVEEYACITSEEPVSQRNAQLQGVCTCSPLSKCDGVTTECFCEAGFEMAGSLCLPVQGCLNLPYLVERSQQCLPQEVCGGDGVCRCEEDCSGGTSPMTTPTGDTSATGMPDIVLIVFVACVPLLLFIVIVLVAILIMCKCRQQLEKSQRRRKPPPTILHQNEQLNNRSDELNLKDGGVRVQEVPPETTSHPMHHLPNGSASSGFVDEIEHDLLKYGQTSSFNGYSQTQSDIDEAGFPADGNPYVLQDHTSIPRPPYFPYEIQEEGDSVPYYPHNGNGMRPVEAPPHVPDHLLPRSLSEEARLVQMGGMSGGAYTPLEEGRQYPQNYPDGYDVYYPHSQGSTHAQPHPSHGHSHHHSHHSHHSVSSGGRDARLMVGLDSALVRAIEQVAASDTGSRSPSVSSSISGSRNNSIRRSRRRHHRGHAAGHGGHREPRVSSPVGTHSAQGFYGYDREGDAYQSNTLPRSGPSGPQRSPRHQEVSPLIASAATPKTPCVRSASNEILETRRPRPIPPLAASHDMSHDASHDHRDPPVEMPQALPDEPLIFQATNPHTISPPVPSSGEADYDHINTPPVPSPPPPLPANFKPPTAKLVPPRQPPPPQRSPPSSSSQFPQELFNAIQKRANSMDTSPGVAKPTTSSPAQPSPIIAPAPPPRTVSDRRGKSIHTSTPARFTPAFLSAYNRGNPPSPPIRSSSNQGQNNSLVSNQAGVPPPPPPPPVRSS